MTIDEALEVFEENLPELEQLEKKALEAIEKPTAHDYALRWVQSNVYLIRQEQVRKRYAGLRNALYRKKHKPTAESLDVQKAKAYPIENLLPHPVVRGKTLCPLHNERTPSCTVKDNKFYCFGCQAHGDPIDLYQKIHNCDFITAVKALQ